MGFQGIRGIDVHWSFDCEETREDYKCPGFFGATFFGLVDAYPGYLMTTTTPTAMMVVVIMISNVHDIYKSNNQYTELW